jgi:hypothetical protein
MSAHDEIIEDARRGFSQGLREGFAEISKYYADPIDIVHIPASPVDGLQSVKEVMARTDVENDAMLPTLSKFSIEPTFTVDGDVITATMSCAIETKDGRTIEFTSSQDWTIDDGKITRYVSRFEGGEAFLGAFPPEVMEKMAAGTAEIATWADRNFDQK